jgi:hypothetical protein
MRIAIFSDVHSNLPTLDAVLADIAAPRSASTGDTHLGISSATRVWPNEVVERLRTEAIPSEGRGYPPPSRA